jgi:hydroxyethylthiazole kinase-like uncharacterized protein yjeF
MNTIRRLDSQVGREPLAGVAATRRIEIDAAKSLPAFTLMTRAGDAVARLALALAPHAKRIAVHAGPGNNGGDGLEAALRLHAMGKDVAVLLCADPVALPPDAANAFSRARDAGVRIATAPDGRTTDEFATAELVIDALLGIGASRPPAAEIAAAIAAMAKAAARGGRILSIDVPSGLDAERGQPIGEACVVAHDTLTLLAAKPGLFTSAGRDHAGRVWIDRLGVDTASTPADAWLVGRGELARFAGRRLQAQHKGSFGDVAIVGGAAGMEGAALLASRAAHAAGAGRVFVDLLGDASKRFDVDAQRPELMMRHDWSQGPAEVVSTSTVVCGCGGGDDVRAALPRLLSLAPRLVLDADALNAIAADTGLQAMLGARASRSLQTILTPHPLEAARLLATTAKGVQGDRLRAAVQLSARYRAVVVLKGSGTVGIAPGDRPFVNATGNASLATAGTGDVLAGWIGGRWRVGMSAIDVALQGVIEHGAAAEPELPGALRAADLVEALYRLSRTAR